METRYIILDRITGELYNGNNLQRFYYDASSAKGQFPHYIGAIMEITFGPDGVEMKMVDDSKLTEDEFYEGTNAEIAYLEEMNEGLKSKDKKPLSDYCQELLEKREKRLYELKYLRYEMLIYR